MTAATAGCLSRFRSEKDPIPSDAIDITDHGADPTGEESIHSTLENVAESFSTGYVSIFLFFFSLVCFLPYY